MKKFQLSVAEKFKLLRVVSVLADGEGKIRLLTMNNDDVNPMTNAQVYSLADELDYMAHVLRISLLPDSISEEDLQELLENKPEGK